MHYDGAMYRLKEFAPIAKDGDGLEDGLPPVVRAALDIYRENSAA